jgi:hypothetical protein
LRTESPTIRPDSTSSRAESSPESSGHTPFSASCEGREVRFEPEASSISSISSNDLFAGTIGGGDRVDGSGPPSSFVPAAEDSTTSSE